jgi:hypothetical protein
VAALRCDDCGAEVRGMFASCRYCSLSAADAELLAVFLGSRGNTKEVERRYAVSYPTARARIDALLERLQLGDPATERRLEILRAVARGATTVDDAMTLLGPEPPHDQNGG